MVHRTSQQPAATALTKPKGLAGSRQPTREPARPRSVFRLARARVPWPCPWGRGCALCAGAPIVGVGTGGGAVGVLSQGVPAALGGGGGSGKVGVSAARGGAGRAVRGGGGHPPGGHGGAQVSDEFSPLSRQQGAECSWAARRRIKPTHAPVPAAKDICGLSSSLLRRSRGHKSAAPATA